MESLVLLQEIIRRKVSNLTEFYTPKDGQVDGFADASPMVVSSARRLQCLYFCIRGNRNRKHVLQWKVSPQNRGVNNYRTVEQLFEVGRGERQFHITYRLVSLRSTMNR